VNGLYNKTVQLRCFERLGKLKPASREEALQALAYLKQEGATDGRALTSQAIAADGIDAVMKSVKESFASYLASKRTDQTSKAMAASVATVTEQIPEKSQRTAWALALAEGVGNRLYYFNKSDHVTYDQAIRLVRKLAGLKGESSDPTYAGLRQQLNEDLKDSASGQSELGARRKLAKQIRELAKAINQPETIALWQKELSDILAGQERFIPKNAKPNAKLIPDPCVQAIAELSKTPPMQAPRPLPGTK
jgi:hypothetical protein